MVQARDPWTTASLIVALLCCYNILLAVTHIAISILLGDPVNPIDRVWDYRGYHFSSIPGYKTALVQVITVALCVPVEVLVVQRAKLILDFAMTTQFFQLLFTWLYSDKFPSSWAWWFTWLVSSIILVFGGEYACMKIELQPLTFGSGNTTTQRSSAVASATPQADTDERRETTQGGQDIELEERDKLMEEGTAIKP